ncbi:mastermind-like protein 2 [Protobothrops mucrosquamatus]|uniref:mastermind-like protein 2 n=1 Tax=Protobothrops mucrosquamatus TaxID=103944 RepID=UPI0007757867|nr:mastermind-like protein 2 [Protobothrops mucrosquamatus]
MGDTAPPQALGLLVGGGGGGSMAAAAAAAPPRVHSAIVERLRARIAVCRQHHLTCEGRYERGRAESSDRERENTLQLLNLVQHGQAARKGSKHSKAAAAAAGTAGGSSSAAAAASANAAAPPAADYYPQQLISNGSAGGRNGINGEQPGAVAGGEPRNPALIALQGSLKRKLVVNLTPGNNKRSNGIADNTFLDIKRIRGGDNNLSMGRGQCGNNCPNQSVLGSFSVGQGAPRKMDSSTNNSHSGANGMFNMTLKEVKKEPGETISCSKHMDGPTSQNSVFPNRYGEDTAEQLMDPELQELFNELSNISVPPMSDLELENMINATIKQDEPFNIDIGHQIQRGTPAQSSSLQMDKMVIKQEYSPGLNQASVGSPQMRPPSTDSAFTLSGAAMSTSSPIPSVPQTQTPPSQGTSVPPRPLANWQEVSHAQQLKQIAANRQQHALIQQCQQSQSATSWPGLSSTEPSSGSFVQEKMSSPSFHQQQQFSPQGPAISGIPVSGTPSKGMNSYAYRPNSMPQGSSVNMVMPRKSQDIPRNYVNNNQVSLEEPQNIKPLFHFNSEQANKQMSSGLGAPHKPSLVHYAQQPPQQLSNSAVQPQTSQQQQQQAHSAQSLQTQHLQRPPNVSLALQQKIMLQKMLQNQPASGLQYMGPQNQLNQHTVLGQSGGTNPGSASCTNANTGTSYISSSPQTLLNQQLKQQFLLQQQQQQQQILSEAEKATSQDQLNRHLTRPPPDYKDQRRGQVNVQQAHQYSGGSPAVSINSNLCFSNPISTSNILSQQSNLLSTAHGLRMSSLPAGHHVSCYGNIPCSQPNAYNVATPGVSQVAQHRNLNPIVTSQNNPAASRPTPPGQGNNMPTFDNGLGVNSQQGKLSLNQGTSAQRPSNVMVSSNAAAQNWASSEAGSKQQETQRASGSPFSSGSSYTNQQLQRTAALQQFPQRAMVPPNQLGTIQMRTPASQMNQSLNGQVGGASKPQSAMPTQLQAEVVAHLNPPRVGMTQPHPLSSNQFSSSATQMSTRVFQGTDHASDLAFDFLNQQADNIGPALNSDPDFIDSLLKTEPSNDDWMKDINLDEILGGHS